eukprot:TRINITY_DN7460_c0_g1_i1.p1 TRINITY_DN7460_c0_g1~~TRINITY_DN7460_c0_g1_i1.p1  ORF type:complete len:522 (+),score=106.72 TRINITY_DN7460_c0_g1_i1:75-1568(+)
MPSSGRSSRSRLRPPPLGSNPGAHVQPAQVPPALSAGLASSGLTTEDEQRYYGERHRVDTQRQLLELRELQHSRSDSPLDARPCEERPWGGIVSESKQTNSIQQPSTFGPGSARRVRTAAYDVHLRPGDSQLGASWCEVLLSDGSSIVRVTPMPGGALWAAGVPAASVVHQFDGVLHPSVDDIVGMLVSGGGTHRVVVESDFDEHRWPSDAYSGDVDVHVSVLPEDGELGIRCEDTPSGVRIVSVAPFGACARAHVPSDALLLAVSGSRVTTTREAARLIADARGSEVETLVLTLSPAGRPPEQRPSVAEVGVVRVGSIVKSSWSTADPVAKEPVRVRVDSEDVSELRTDTKKSLVQVQSVVPISSEPPLGATASPTLPYEKTVPATGPVAQRSESAEALIRGLRASLLSVSVPLCNRRAQPWLPVTPEPSNPDRVISVDLRDDSTEDLRRALTLAGAELEARVAAAAQRQQRTSEQLQEKLWKHGVRDWRSELVTT